MSIYWMLSYKQLPRPIPRWLLCMHPWDFGLWLLLIYFADFARVIWMNQIEKLRTLGRASAREPETVRVEEEKTCEAIADKE